MSDAVPPLPVEVDEATGWWRAGALPMILVPQHFLVNNHRAVEAELGPERHRAILDPAGHASAWHWCEREAAVLGLDPVATFRHYLDRLSRRGWGRFAAEAIDAEAGTARIRLDHSVFVAHYGRDAGRAVCYMHCGWWEGAMGWVGAALGRTWRARAEEVECAAAGAACCRFEVAPRA